MAGDYHLLDENRGEPAALARGIINRGRRAEVPSRTWCADRPPLREDATPELAAEAARAGVFCCIDKPSDLEAVARIVDQALPAA
jgi:hypothetical protein